MSAGGSGEHTALTAKRLRHSGVPVVETWDLPARPIDMVAGFSNFEAGRAVAQFLLARGYLRLAFAGGPDERSSARLAGVRAALKGVHGTALSTGRLAAGASFEGGGRVITKWLTLQQRPQAIFFGNDALAAGALMECQRRKLRVPQDVAIMGFADLDIAAAIEPPLSSVRVPTRAMGESAAQMLLARLKGESAGAGVCDLGFEIMSRAST